MDLKAFDVTLRIPPEKRPDFDSGLRLMTLSMLRVLGAQLSELIALGSERKYDEIVKHYDEAFVALNHEMMVQLLSKMGQ